MAEPARMPLPPEGREDRFPGWFADRLRHWRRMRGLSQEGLGWAAEISTRHLSFLESGRSRPSEEMLMRLLSVLDEDLDMVALVLDPRLTRSFLVNFDELALRVVNRLHLGSLERPRDPLRKQILDRALAYPGIAELWEHRTSTDPHAPATRLHLLRDGFEVCFETLLTSLSEPLQPAFSDLFIESYYPLDEATRIACLRSGFESD